MKDELVGAGNRDSSVPARLARLKTKILAAWERQVRAQVPGAGKQAHAVLRDSLPEFLDGIVRALRDQGPYSEACMNQVCRVHGEQRAALLRYTPDQVVTEYRILRETLFTLLEEGGPIAVAERELIHRGIDLGIADAVSQFAIEQASVEQKINEEALHLAARLQALIQSSPIGLGFLDSDFRYVEVNEPLARLNGRPAADHIGRTVQEVLSKEYARIEPLLTHVFATGEPMRNLEFSVELPGDPVPVHYVLANYFPVKGADARVLGIGASVVDITDVKVAEKRAEQSEARLRTFVEAMPQMTFIANANGEIESYNNRHYEYFGGTPGEKEACGWQQGSLHHPEDLQRTIETWNQSVRTGEPYQIEYRLRRRDGAFRWHLGRAVPVRDGSGQITSWLGTNTDIHEQKLLQQELSTTVASLQAEREIREQVVSTLTHDLRTPLVAANMAAQSIIRQRDLPEEAFTLSLRIIQNMARADHMIHDLLDVQRLKAGKSIELQMEPLDLAEVAREALGNLATIYGERFVLKTQGSLSGYWSRENVARVIENLCVNAVKYGDAKAPITVSVSEQDAQVRIAVHNVGEPLAADDRSRLFSQFERLGPAKMSRTRGWGIGLTIVKEVAEAHGGMASARPVEDGTEFVVCLPRDARPQQRTG